MTHDEPTKQYPGSIRTASEHHVPQHRCLALLLTLVAVIVFPQLCHAEVSANGIASSLPRMVKIYGSGGVRGIPAFGTGFFVSAEGHIVTTWSATLLDDDRVTVVLDDGRRLEARVKGLEPHLDLAVLELDGEHVAGAYAHFDLDDVVDVTAGTRVLGFSNMYKVAAGDEPVSVIHGVVAARVPLNLRRGAFETAYDGPVYVVDGITNTSGAAGGVLTTLDGRLVAMIGKEHRNAATNTWINYAVPVSQLRDSIRQIITGEFRNEPAESDRPGNPMRFTPIDFGIVLVPDVVYRTPAYVDDVQPDSAAARAGLRPNDLILFANDELISSCRLLKNALGWLETGDTLRLVVRRGDTLVNLELPVRTN